MMAKRKMKLHMTPVGPKRSVVARAKWGICFAYPLVELASSQEL